MSSGPSGPTPTAVHLVPVDEDWVALLDQIEEPLLMQLTGVQDHDSWELPDVFTGEFARDSWWRIRQAVRAAFERAERHRLLAPDGKFELAPLALVEIAKADVLIDVAYECSRAQAGLGSADLADADRGPGQDHQHAEPRR
jgi:hypothetical protein